MLFANCLIRGVIFTTITCIVGFTMCTPILATCSALLLFTLRFLPQYRFVHYMLRKGINIGLALFYRCPIALLQLMGVRFRILVPSIQKHLWNNNSRELQDCMFISNHPSDCDWIFLWALFNQQFNLNTLKILLKASIRNIPGMGSATMAGCHLFVERDWDKDQKHMTRVVQYYGQHPESVQWLLFPEGTNSSNPTAQVKSAEFARTNNLAVTTHVLHPRSTGFSHMLQQLALHKPIRAIYDITIGFRSKRPLQLHQFLQKSLLRGHFPDEICFFVQRYDVPQQNQNHNEWLQARFDEKERLLARFYENTSNQSFSTDEIELPVSRISIGLLYLSLVLLLTVAWFSFSTNWGRWWSLFGLLFYLIVSVIVPIPALDLLYLRLSIQ